MKQVKEMALSIKKVGLKKSFKRYGWHMVSLVVLYYLIRDTILYIIIPYWIATSF